MLRLYPINVANLKADPAGTVILYVSLYTLQCNGEVPVDAMLWCGLEER